MYKIQAVIIENKIFLPCICTYEEGSTLYGSASYEVNGYVTPDLTYFVKTHGLYAYQPTEKMIQLTEDSPYRNFQFKDLDIEKLEIPWKYIKQIPTVQGLVKQLEEK